MSLPRNLQTVITKNSGHVIPDELFELIIAKKPNSFGFAVQGEEELTVVREEGTPDLEDLKEFNRNAMDFRALVCFGWLSQFNPEDILPLVLQEGDNAFLAVALEGDFPKFDNNDGRTQEFNLAAELIIPSLNDICELTDGDITKLVAAIGKPSFNNNFFAQVGHRGVLSILPREGDIISFSKNELGEVYDWGSTSMRHGYGDTKQEPVKAEEPKKRFSFGKKVTPPALPQEAAKLPKDVATKGEGPKTSVPEVKKVGATTIKETKKEADGPLPVRPPDWCHKNDDKRSWYQMVGGNLPKGWKHNIPVIPVNGVTPPAKIEDLDAWRANRAKAAIAAQPKEQKTATSAGVPKTGAEVKAIRQEESLPIIAAKEMEVLLDFVAKHLDGQSVQMPKPDEIQAIEKKFPALSEALGLKPQDLLNWPVSGLFALGKHDYRALVLGFLEMRNLWRATLKMEDLVGTDKPTVTTTVTKSGEGTVKTESISNEPPAKKKMFSFGKKAA